MRSHVLFGALVAGTCSLLACTSEPLSEPSGNRSVSASRVAAGGGTLVVDNDLADCPQADFISIQAAVSAAQPGVTILVCPGTYFEWVVIDKNDLRVLAKGQPGDVVLDGQNLPAPLPCSPLNAAAVRCAGFELRNADGNLIEGFVVRRYWEAGIWLRMGSDSNTIRKNVTTESPHHDGIQVANSSFNVVEQNTSHANFALLPAPTLNACGINVTASVGMQSVGNTVRHNDVFANDFGIQIAGAGAAGNVVFQNETHENRRFGVRNVAGANGTQIEENRSLANNGPGIALLASNLVTVARNKAFDNAPDISWDALGANGFENNHCRTSVPPGLCEHMEGASKQ